MIDIIFLTLKISVVATLLNIPLALIIGWAVGRKNFRGKFLLELLVSLPLALPPVVLGYMLLLLVGRSGPIGQISHLLFGSDIVFTWVAATLAASVVSLPLMARATIVSMSSVDETLERSARSLGAGPFRTFLTITIPLSYHGVLGGILIGFVRALAEFGATIIVAGNIPGSTQTIPLAIYNKVQLGRNDEALVLVGVSVLLAICTLSVYTWLLSRSGKNYSL
ncbi:MAG: molybdate ABC transporter permease subunit [Chloroflexi bacterium]|nr:molybdate ABC transporter permease subunit [Chloroflexota bacterium]